jgi:hypothetical protein
MTARRPSAFADDGMLFEGEAFLELHLGFGCAVEVTHELQPSAQGGTSSLEARTEPPPHLLLEQTGGGPPRVAACIAANAEGQTSAWCSLKTDGCAVASEASGAPMLISSH